MYCWDLDSKHKIFWRSDKDRFDKSEIPYIYCYFIPKESIKLWEDIFDSRDHSIWDWVMNNTKTEEEKHNTDDFEEYQDGYYGCRRDKRIPNSMDEKVKLFRQNITEKIDLIYEYVDYGHNNPRVRDGPWRPKEELNKMSKDELREFTDEYTSDIIRFHEV